MMISQETLDLRMKAFRSRCAECGLSLTHQRWVIYRTLAGTVQHLTPEETFKQVRRDIPSISLATVYKNIKTFLDARLLKEVSTPRQTMRLDANLDPHCHFVCASCSTILDISQDCVAPIHLKKGLPRGFQVVSYEVNFLGLCGQCSPRAHAAN